MKFSVDLKSNKVKIGTPKNYQNNLAQGVRLFTHPNPESFLLL